MRLTARSCLLVTLALALPQVAEARDWFVRTGAAGGDGSQQKPFDDPWRALDQCEAGDAIHVAEGRYFGKLRRGRWVIPFPRVSLLGGYKADFSRRNPWLHPTHLSWDPQSKNKDYEARVSAGKDHRDVAVDGFILDMSDRNVYGNNSLLLKRMPLAIRIAPVAFSQPGASIRNCVIVNPAVPINVRSGMRVENTVIINAINTALKVRKGSTLRGADLNKPVVIRGNSLLFTWSDAAPATGGAFGLHIDTDHTTVIEANILAHSDNHAVVARKDATERLVLKDNVFFRNLFSNFTCQYQGQELVVDDEEMDALEEVGLKDDSGNTVTDPGFSYPVAWLDLFSRRKAAVEGKVTMDDWNKTRRALGLPLLGSGGKPAQNFAPRWDWKDAIKLAQQSRKFGAQAKDLPVVFKAETANAGPAREYESAPARDWYRKPAPVDGKPVQLLVGLGQRLNLERRKVPEGVSHKTHRGITLCDAEKPGARIVGYYRRGSRDERAIDAGGLYSSGKVDRPYTVRGIARALSGYPKAGLIIESVERYEAPSVAAKARPQGRDWFVRAGARKGDGSRAKPFKDPYKALKKAKPGDNIHVAQGEYTGFFKRGTWAIDKPYLALYGGYNDDFSQRDPWTTPSLLLWKPAKSKPTDATIEGGTNPHDELILDGFVFDRRHLNLYRPNGDLDFSRSSNKPHVWANAKNVTIRNCVFVNGGWVALRLTGNQTIENNIFINHPFFTVDVKAVASRGLTVFRHNTVLFSWNYARRAGRKGASSGYGLLIQRARANIENNVFQFIDNNAVVLQGDLRDVELTGNVFSHNLWSNVKHYSKTVVDDANMKLLEDMGFRKVEGNRVANPDFPLDPAWMDIYLNRSQGSPGKVTMDKWNKLRSLLGKPLVAKGGTAGSGFAPAYPWKKALKLFPRAKDVKAGARKLPLKSAIAQRD